MSYNELMQTVIDYYNQALSLIPEAYRLPIAIIVLIVLVFSLIKFLKKNLVWIVIFIILLPAAYPAVRQVALSVWNLIQKAPK